MNNKKYQVFISSTYKDLVEERKKVQEVILSMYQFPIGMEMFSADDEEQWETIKETIDSSDYYVLIIGHRYGSETSEGISFTEKEYDYAKSKNIPILSFIRNRDVALKDSERESSTEKNEKLIKFIKKSEDNKMCDYWTDKEELGTKVSVTLYKQILKNKRPGWIRSDNLNIDNIVNEMSELSKENRKLKLKLEELERLQIVKIPKIGVEINNNSDIKLDFLNFNQLLNYNKIMWDVLTEKQKENITIEEINEYNSSLPTKSEIHFYNIENEKYWRVKNTGVCLEFNIYNDGNIKANDINIEIIAPEEILILKEYEINNYKKPEGFKIKSNPLVKSNETFTSSYAVKFPVLEKMAPNVFSKRSSKYITVINNAINIHLDNLLHKKKYNFADKIKLIPLNKGVYEMKISIICEEYTDKMEYIKQITVQ